MANRWRSNGNCDRIYFLGLQITVNGYCSHEIKRQLLLGKNATTKLDSILKSKDITLPTKVYLIKAMVFPTVMYGYGPSRSRSAKELMFWTVVLEKTLESPVDSKEIQPVHPKGNQSWIFTGRTDAEADTPIFWLSDVKSWLTWKEPDAGKIEGRRRRG